jgi:flagellar basal-body rod protein FlgB
MDATNDLMALAFSAARHAGRRQELVATNIANADTPGYRAQDIADFSATYSDTDDFSLRATRPGHAVDDGDAAGDAAFAIGGPMSPNGNDVSLEEEMVRGAVTRREHDAALAIYRSSLDILRSTLGKR